jgi:hypothetical protein
MALSAAYRLIGFAFAGRHPKVWQSGAIRCV